MTARPTRIAQTSSEAKKAYKKNGGRLSADQKRRLERGLELDQRAARFRAQEQRKRAAKQKRDEKLRKEREARQQLGVGLATQLVGYSRTQANLKSGMESFLGLKGKRAAEEREKTSAAQINKKLEAIAETVDQDPWDDAEDFGLDHLAAPASPDEDSWIDDDLDDETLLEAHNLLVPDTIHEAPGEPHPSPHPSPHIPTVTSTDREFLRLHGPINKAIENVLDQLPAPVIELLSIDCSMNHPAWSPPPSLLHKLNPVGIPPHRLRIKVGCVVSLLRDLDTSTQPSKSSHLQVLRVGNERLECLVLDGQLEGTKTFLTRLQFHAKYRNQDSSPFQRLQFPVRVSTNFPPPKLPRPVSQSTFKMPSVPGRPVEQNTKPSKQEIRRVEVAPSVQSGLDFKLPGRPASKDSKPTTQCRIPATPITVDGWDDFLETGSQIARELSSESPINQDRPNPKPPSPPEDIGFTLEDLDELVLSQIALSSSATSVLLEGAQASSRNPIELAKARVKTAMSRSRLQPNLKRKVRFETPKPAKKPRDLRAVATNPSPLFDTSSHPFPFSELGWSTQEANSFFDDDDDDFTAITA